MSASVCSGGIGENSIQKKAAINANLSMKDVLLTEASLRRDTLQDAVDIDGATSEKAEALPLRKKYHVLLS
ncbi:tail fiber assembly protein (plasmid) [Erwinia pyri]|uniref:Tail fiber assembly protein n=1 Tax=Erwinia pyri TaxID=3062598 RepID=A0AA50HNH7_9GAMM|nr:tail fiber assembly protein [Erwinia sp. DE2]WLS81108.1 tail fiber assembly protein [Erwinia sp. DE2]